MAPVISDAKRPEADPVSDLFKDVVAKRCPGKQEEREPSLSGGQKPQSIEQIADLLKLYWIGRQITTRDGKGMKIDWFLGQIVAVGRVEAVRRITPPLQETPTNPITLQASREHDRPGQCACWPLHHR